MPGLAPALERLPVGVLQVGFDGRIHALNDCLGGWLGRSAAALIGQSVDELLSRPGRVLPDRPWDLPSLRAMDARVAVALNQLDLDTPKLAPLSPVNQITASDRKPSTTASPASTSEAPKVASTG